MLIREQSPAALCWNRNLYGLGLAWHLVEKLNILTLTPEWPVFEAKTTKYAHSLQPCKFCVELPTF